MSSQVPSPANGVRSREVAEAPAPIVASTTDTTKADRTSWDPRPTARSVPDRRPVEASRSEDADRPLPDEREDMAIQLVRRISESQFVRFCAVGASGYAINLAAYTFLLAAGLHYLVAAAISFLIAAGSNYIWNRT